MSGTPASNKANKKQKKSFQDILEETGFQEGKHYSSGLGVDEDAGVIHVPSTPRLEPEKDPSIQSMELTESELKKLKSVGAFSTEGQQILINYLYKCVGEDESEEILDRFFSLPTSEEQSRMLTNQIRNKAKKGGERLIGFLEGIVNAHGLYAHDHFNRMIAVLSSYVDDLSARNMALEEDNNLIRREMDNLSKQVNSASERLTHLPEAVDKLERVVNDLYSKPLITSSPNSHSGDQSSSPKKARLIPEIEGEGVYHGPFGSVTLTGSSIVCEMPGREGVLLEKLLYSKPSINVKIRFLNLDLELLVGYLEDHLEDIEQLHGSDKQARIQAGKKILESVPPRTHQWRIIQ